MKDINTNPYSNNPKFILYYTCIMLTNKKINKNKEFITIMNPYIIVK